MASQSRPRDPVASARVRVVGTLGAIALLALVAAAALAENDGVAAAIAGTAIALLAVPTITLFKGKGWTVVIGLLTVKFGGWTFWIIGAIKLAKPDSTWARAFYTRNPEKLARAKKRFADAPPAPARARQSQPSRRSQPAQTYIYVDARSVHIHEGADQPTGQREQAHPVIDHSLLNTPRSRHRRRTLGRTNQTH